MIVIQRIRVQWDATARGALHANARRGLDQPVPLPDPLPAADVILHEVFADDTLGYERRHDLLAGDVSLARRVDLRLTTTDDALTVERVPGDASFPRPGPQKRLFTLAPGQVGRYRANFRFTGRCPCNDRWWYEDWLIHVSHGPLRFQPNFSVDNRVSLYGRR